MTSLGIEKLQWIDRFLCGKRN